MSCEFACDSCGHKQPGEFYGGMYHVPSNWFGKAISDNEARIACSEHCKDLLVQLLQTGKPSMSTEALLMPEFSVDDADTIFLKFLDLAGYLAKLTSTTIDDQAVAALVASDRLRRWALEMILNLFDQDAPVDRLPAMQVPDDVQLALGQAGLPLGSVFDLLIKYGPTLITFLGPLLKNRKR